MTTYQTAKLRPLLARTAFTAWLLLLVACWSPAQEAAMFGEMALVEDGGQSVFQAGFDEPLEPTGPGFRFIGRLHFGGFVQRDDEVLHDLHPTDPVHFTRLELDLRRSLTSLDYTRLYLWDPELGVLDTPPGWRLTMDGLLLHSEVGRLPVANLAYPCAPPAAGGQGWLDGFEHARYFGWGVRFTDGVDKFDYDGQTNVAGRTYSENDVYQFLLGPELLVGRTSSKGRWMFDASASVQAGYGYARLKQENAFGVTFPGSGALSVAPEYSSYRETTDYVGAFTEFKLASSYAFKTHWTLDLVGRAFAASHWYRSDAHVIFPAPDYGLKSPSADSLVGANLYLGVTYLR